MNDTLGDTLNSHLEALLERVRVAFPGWRGCQDQRFLESEVDYKRRLAAKARELLAEERLRELAGRERWAEILDSFETVAKDKEDNLLYRATPLAGDMNILYQPNLDQAGLCRALVDLVHGDGDGADRLGRYLAYVEGEGLPSKWTLPTYFLFLSHPDKETFVKPSVIKRLCGLIGSENLSAQKPSADAYRRIRALVQVLKAWLEPYGARDMIDAQSFMYIVAGPEKEGADSVDGKKKEEFSRLFEEFLSSYPATADGQRHKALYVSSRSEASTGLASIKADQAAGRDVTDKILLRLLPHADTQGNRARGAWVCVAPAITKDVKAFFEGAGWIRADQWASAAQALLAFVSRCMGRPGELAAACGDFTSLPYTKGFQSGFLSPILNALRPEEFLLVNSKSRRVLKYLTGKSFDLNLRVYPDANGELRALVAELAEDLPEASKLGLLTSDVFDMFCHWLVAVKRFAFADTKYWKIAPGEEGSEWEGFREGGFVGMGWAELGDVSGLSRAEYEKRRNELVEQHLDWTRAGVDQVWRFARQVKEGDYVVANRGTKKVLGLGVVSGQYYFEPNARFGHRLPVDWLPFEPVEVRKPGWIKTLIELTAQDFEEIRQLGPGEGVVVPLETGGAFSREAFDLLAGLAAQPTREYYLSRKQQFVDFVEGPFQALLHQVVAALSPPITEAMETERNLFSRIPKNDWGRGGAWPFYWGALYPKGGRRVEDAQLFLGLHPSRLTFGFYIGEYGSEQRQRFVRNCKSHHEELKNLLAPLAEEGRMVWGSAPDDAGDSGVHEGPRESPTFGEWLRTVGDQEARGGAWIPKGDVLKVVQEELAARIARAFQLLFPLVLLATWDDPLPKLRQYLEGDEAPEESPIYPLEAVAADTGLSQDLLESWVRAIERKKQAVVFGPPGTGKTFVAQRLARHLVGGSAGFIDLVQFHPSYAYEDFMQGIRPQRRADGQLDYQLVPGRFLDFCARARTVPGRCVLIIDEINRAKLSSVFGELMFLMEYRDQTIPLAGRTVFGVPPNVRIIGTMNTADRSIALVDHALRRRFAFLLLAPNFDVLRSYHKRINPDFNVESLIVAIEGVNKAIANPDYEVGITYFIRESIETEIEDIWRMEIEPYLREYFFDRQDKVEAFRWEAIREKVMG